MSVKDVVGDYETFFLDALNRLERISIDVKQMPISHIAFRTSTAEEYEMIRDKLKPYCKEFVETQHNGRAVSVFEIRTRLPLPNGFTFSVIELPAPRAEHTYPSGLEHVGFLVSDLPTFKEQHKRVLTGEKDLGVSFPAFVTFENGKTAKFYERTLKEIVMLQGWNFQKL